MKKFLLVSLLMLAAIAPAHAAEPVALKYDRAALEVKWRARIQSFLDKGVVPLIDMETSLKRADGEAYLADALPVMDELGMALMAFDGRQAGKRGGGKKGYRWGYYIHEIVNAHPDRFILASNGGTNRNWTRGKNSYISQLEEQVANGGYPLMGEIEFRHYMSNQQCKKERTDRDVDVPIDGENGHRVFALSAATGVPFAIHHEPEDRALDGLEKMLKAYPKAKIIVAHFGQVRHPSRQKRFTPALVRRLLGAYLNLYYDISTGHPGRIYKCNDVTDTVIWQDGTFGGQTDELKPEYGAILTEFSDRFVAATDYGGGRKSLADYLRKRVRNIRLILRDLPDEAKHDIGYRNAWRLLTGRNWAAARQKAAVAPAVAARTETPPPYTGVISDAHGHIEGRKADPDGTIAAMDRNNIDRVVVFAKSKGGRSDDDVLAMQRDHSERVVTGIGFQNKGWHKQKRGFMRDVADKAASGRFAWLGEVSFRGKIGGKLNAPADTPLLRELMELSVETGLPITIHHNPYERDGGAWRQTGEYGELVENLASNPKAVVVWAHWCGLAPPQTVHTLLQRLPNLHCDLAWIHKPQASLPNRLIDKRGDLRPEWKALIEEFPNRFLVGVDSAAKPGHLRDFDRRVRLIRHALGGLRPEVARKVATGNFHRLIRRSAK